MNILITGATGFIGSHLTKELCKQGYHCRCLVRNIEKAIEIFKDYEDIEFVVGDVTKPETLKDIANNIDVVFHLAAHGHVAADSEEAYKRFIDINVTGTENFIKQCAQGNIQKFFHFSSTAAVGLIPDIVVDENTKPNPQTPYQKSKLESEKLVKKFTKKEKFPAIIYRPCMVYGIGGYGEFYKFVRLVKKGIMPKIGFKKKLTPIVYVEDVVQACIKGMEGAKIGEIYFICGKESYPFDRIIDNIKINLDSKKVTIWVPYFLAISGAYFISKYSELTNKIPIVTPKNIGSTYANREFSIRKAMKDFGYNPLVGIEEGTKKVVNFFKRAGNI
jgi:nucleoside-diphosphate-sugar epimerase